MSNGCEERPSGMSLELDEPTSFFRIVLLVNENDHGT